MLLAGSVETRRTNRPVEQSRLHPTHVNNPDGDIVTQCIFFYHHVTDARKGMMELIVEVTKSRTQFAVYLNRNQSEPFKSITLLRDPLDRIMQSVVGRFRGLIRTYIMAVIGGSPRFASIRILAKATSQGFCEPIIVAV
jgi:hypothetical protein